MKLLLWILGASLPLWAVTESATWCEHRLVAVKSNPQFFFTFRNMIESGIEEFPAYPVRWVQPLGLRRFNIFDPKIPLALSVYVSTLNRDSVVVTLSTEGKIAYKSLIRMPPLYLWKQLEESDDQAVVMFPETEAAWDSFGMGLVLESSFQSRKYVEIVRNRKGQRKIVLGIDVDCELARTYGSSPRRYVLLREGYYLCRVPVIEAPIPGSFTLQVQ